MSQATAETILFVDDEPAILAALKRLFRKTNLECHFSTSAQEALELLSNQRIDLVVSDMRMPNMDGAAFLSKVKESWPDTVRMLLTGHSDIAATVSALNEGGIFRYIYKPWNDDELKEIILQGVKLSTLEREKQELLKLTRLQNTQLKRFNEELERKVEARTEEIQQTADMLDLALAQLKEGYDLFVRVLSSIISSRPKINQKKANIVGELVNKISQKVNFGESESKNLYYAALLHELGKLSLPDELLSSPENMLSESQFERYVAYPALGEMILMGIYELDETAKIIGHHMERYDGKGHPGKLSGKSIHKGARVLRAVKDFVGLQMGSIENRPFSSAEAYEFLLKQAGKIYDPGVVKILGLFKNSLEIVCENEDEIKTESFNLKPGMTITRDVLSQSGIMLISKNYALTPGIIEKILSFEKLDGKRLDIYVSKKSMETPNEACHI